MHIPEKDRRDDADNGVGKALSKVGRKSPHIRDLKDILSLVPQHSPCAPNGIESSPSNMNLPVSHGFTGFANYNRFLRFTLGDPWIVFHLSV
jgi:hypothetical protein